MADDMRRVDWSDLPPEARRLIEELLPLGRKIDAIKVFRRFTGAGLRESKEAVENWGQVESFRDLPAGTRDLIRKIVPGIDPSAPVTVVRKDAAASSIGWEGIPSEARAEIDRLIPEGNLLEAVKVLRRHSGVPLKTARDAVWALAENMGIRPPGGLASAGGCLKGILGFVGWAALVAVMPFLTKLLLAELVGPDLSPVLVEALQVLVTIAFAFLSVGVTVYLLARRRQSREG